MYIIARKKVNDIFHNRLHMEPIFAKLTEQNFQKKTKRIKTTDELDLKCSNFSCTYIDVSKEGICMTVTLHTFP
jgi:hypothetical protein